MTCFFLKTKYTCNVETNHSNQIEPLRYKTYSRDLILINSIIFMIEFKLKTTRFSKI